MQVRRWGAGEQMRIQRVLTESWIPCRGQTFREGRERHWPLHGMTALEECYFS
jgi:hypothetical protein